MTATKPATRVNETITLNVDGNLINLTVELITPEVAEHYLTFNTHNRNLRRNVVAAYADDIKCGVWSFNGDPIRFSSTGTLLDGQHRLAAIVESETPTSVVVIRGLANDQQHTIDTGARRSFADVLKLRGESHYITLATITRAVKQWEVAPGAQKSATYTNSQLLNVLDRFPWLREGCNPLNLANANAGLPVSASAGPWFAFTMLDSEDCAHFFNRLSSDQGHHEGDPIYTLRRLVLESKKNVKAERNIAYLSAVTIQAWNKFRAGEECKILRWTRGGVRPQPFPEPK